MGCGSCAAAARRRGMKWVWTSDDKTETVVYQTEIAAKAKVQRAGGSYVTQVG